jgi:hypothetical protein
LTELEGGKRRQKLVVYLTLHLIEELSALMRHADGIHKVVKAANNTKLPEKSKLPLRGRSCKLLFSFTDSVPVYCCFYDEVNNVAGAAYTV